MFELVRRAVGDKDVRMTLSAAGGFVFNVVYALINLVFGMAQASAWLVTMGCYYLALGTMRFSIALVRVAGGGRRAHVRSCECVVGVSTLLMTIVLSYAVLLTVRQGARVPGNRILVIAQATYAFAMLSAAIRGLVVAKTGIEHVQRDVSAVAALVSMLTLETTMIDTFGEGQVEFRLVTTAAFGVFVCASCALLGWRLLAGKETARISFRGDGARPSRERTRNRNGRGQAEQVLRDGRAHGRGLPRPSRREGLRVHNRQGDLQARRR